MPCVQYDSFSRSVWHKRKNSLTFGPIIPYLLSVDETVVGVVCCAQGGAWLLHQTPDSITDFKTSRNVPMRNIKKEPCGGWMIVLFYICLLLLDMSIGYVSHFFQDASFCFFFFHPYFLTSLLLWVFDLSLPVRDGFLLAR